MSGAPPPGRLRVLHVIQNLNYGGMERLIAELVGGSDPERFEHHILVLQYLGRFSRELEGIASLYQARPQPVWSMLRPSRLARDVAAIAPDVVHSHSGVWYKAAYAARLASVPRVVHTEHGRKVADSWMGHEVERLASRWTDVIVAVSDVLATQLRDTVVRGSRASVVVIPNGVDVERFAPRPDSGRLRRELGIPPQAPILGSIGRLEHIKGYDLVLEAFSLLGRDWQGEPPHLVLAGDGAERPRLEAMAAAHGTASRARLLGWRDDVEDLLSSFTLFTMASRSEGTSVSLLEAMSSGLCPVVTDVGGNAAVLGDRLRHRLVPPEDSAALAAAWRDALGAPDVLRADACEARSRVSRSFGLDAMRSRYERLYQGLPAGEPERLR